MQTRFTPRKWRKRLDAYELRVGPDGKKQAVYTGAYYTLPADARLRAACVFFPVSIAAVFLAGGSNGGVVSHTIYAILPFMIMFLPLAFMFVYCAPLAMGKTAFKEREKENAEGRLRMVTAATLALALVSLAGTAICAAVNRGLAGDTALFGGCCAYIAAAASCFLAVGRRFIAGRMTAAPDQGPGDDK